VPDFDRNDNFGMQFKEAFHDPHKPFFNKGMPHVILDEWSYSIDKKKVDFISEKIHKYYDEIPEEVRESISFEKETEKLRDSTESSSRNRRESPQYNFDLLNEMSAKIKSCDDISIEDLQLLIFLVQLTISDMKSVGRGGKGYSLQAYELRRRGFKVNPKELLDFLEKWRNR